MIGTYPTIIPGELFYSACARFHRRLNGRGNKATLSQLFGSRTAAAVTDLPCRLGEFERALLPGHVYTARRIAERHTLLPYLTAFLPPGRSRALFDDIRGEGGGRVHRRSGLSAARVPLPERLRYCPRCAPEDAAEYGEPFWRRAHQAPGVLVCVRHGVLLEESGVYARHQRNHYKMVTAEEAVSPSPGRSVPAHLERILRGLAEDAEWLLDNPGLSSEPPALRNRYLRLLVGQGLATYSGGLRAGDLLEEFRRRYDGKVLALLGCELSGRDTAKGCWVLRLARRPHNTHHPLYHLLFIRMLNTSARNFFALPPELKYFGDSPWPCLNPAAEHHLRNVVTECRVTYRGKDQRPVGTFSCSCGHSFARTGPDASERDRYRVGRMKTFGPQWEGRLRALWGDRGLSVVGVARRLGVDPLTVRRHAARLGLTAPAGGRQASDLAPGLRLRGRPDHRSVPAVSSRRREWVSARRRLPRAPLKTLRATSPRLYSWLHRNDRGWLRGQRPPRARRPNPSRSVDWARRDAAISVAVRGAAEKLRGDQGRPRFVSRTAILVSLGLTSLVRQKSRLLPLTAETLAAVAEGREEFAVRRIIWSGRVFRERGMTPRRWQLIEEAGVRRWMGSGAVSQAVDRVLLEPRASSASKENGGGNGPNRNDCSSRDVRRKE
jgi:hypothetical protein